MDQHAPYMHPESTIYQDAEKEEIDVVMNGDGLEDRIIQEMLRISQRNQIQLMDEGLCSLLNSREYYKRSG